MKTLQKTPEEKTLQDCKDEVAQSKYNYKNWSDMLERTFVELKADKIDYYEKIIPRISEAAELYAKTVSEQMDKEIEEKDKLILELVESLEASTKLLKTISRENDLGIALIILNGTIVDNEETINKSRL